MARVTAFQAVGRGFESRLPLYRTADVAQLVEHILGKDEVTGSIPVVGSRPSLARGRAPSDIDIVIARGVHARCFVGERDGEAEV